MKKIGFFDLTPPHFPDSFCSMKDQPFTIKEGEWKIIVAGKVIPAEFNSRGAALAGIKVEQKRNLKKISK